MIQGNYERVLDKIAKSSGLSKEEIEKRIEAKREKLSGLISKEGAAQVIAAELGVSFVNERLKIDELTPGMRKVNVVGKTISLFPVRKFTKNGQESKVANLIIADETSNIKVVLWDTTHVSLIERGEITEGDVILISNASVRDNEVHLGSFSELKISSEILEEVKTEKVVKEKNISDLKLSDSTSVRAFIVQAFDPKTFSVCPECKKKAISTGEGFSCEKHGKIIPEKRALVNVAIDDGTETIRAVLFHENVLALGFNDIENPSLMSQQKENILGKEMVFSGNVRNNKFFNEPELIVERISEIDVDELIEKLEGK